MELAKTDWVRAALCIAAGLLSACQIGKAAIAIPALQQNLGLDLVSTSLIASSYAILGAFGSVFVGVFVARFPMQRVLVAALALIAAGNFAGALSNGLTTLFASRMVEGVGMICTPIAAYTLLRSVVSQKDQPVAFSCWSAHIPGGTALMLGVGPWLLGYGWRMLWVVNGSLAVVLALTIALQAFPKSAAPAISMESPLRAALKMLRSPVPPLLAATFTLYAIHFYSLSTFLPTLLVERMHLSLSTAGTISAVAVLANAGGNIATGFYLRWGFPLWATMAGVFLVILTVGQVVFSPESPIWLVASAAAVGFATTALLPASVFSTIPRFADNNQSIALMLSLIQQSAAIGQLFGPIILASWVQGFGWPGVSNLFLLIALCGLIATWRLSVVTRRS